MISQRFFILCVFCQILVCGLNFLDAADIAAECIDENAAENAKYFGESCTNNTDCFGSPESMSCVNNKCQCNVDFYADKRFVGEEASQTVCVRAPGLFQKCEDVCQKPTTCQVYTGEGADGQNIKVCQCQAPYMLKDAQCILECKDDEYYDGITFKCMPKCKYAEVLIGEKCLPVNGLSSPCIDQRQCNNAFSQCKAGVCTCLDGFDVKSGKCVPKDVNCPNGGTTLKNGEILQMCTIRFDKNNNYRDSCPEGYKCFKTPSDNAGFCCTQWENKCPFGLPHPTALCNNEPACPMDTHYCQSPVFQSGADSDLCCPRQCSPGTAFINGTCFANAKFGDKCIANVQCVESFNRCIGGECSCEPGTISTGKYPSVVCTRYCNKDEVLSADDKCEKRLKLGDACNNETEYRCPFLAYCNRRGQCACQCGAFTLADNVCAPLPVCGRTMSPMTYRSGSSKESSVAQVAHISKEDLKAATSNSTFCKVVDIDPPQGVTIGMCKEDEYCSLYIENVGLCCPKPKAKCPNGAAPIKSGQCDYKNPLSCGLGNICLKYAFSVDKPFTTNSDTACCPDSQDYAAGPLKSTKF